jgi:hypothetical protein
MQNFLIIRIIKSKKMMWAGHATHREIRNAYRIVGQKTKGRKTHVGRPMPTSKDNTKINVKEIGCRVWTQIIWPRRRISSRLL